MNENTSGFSLIELLLALGVASILAMMMFQLFQQNERVMRDQTLIMEMQQTARVVVSQIADEIRAAGQGVPLYAAEFDAAPSEAVAVILGTSNASRIDFRAGLSNVEATADTGARDFTVGVNRNVPLSTASGFLVGRFVYLSGPAADRPWTWIRGELTDVDWASLSLTPAQTGMNTPTVSFTGPLTVSTEEAVSIYLSNGSVRRATASNMSNMANPAWSAANEIGRNVTTLTFTYFNREGNAIQPDSLAKRVTIAGVDIALTVQTSSPLSHGGWPAYSLALRTIPRNLRLGYVRAQ